MDEFVAEDIDVEQTFNVDGGRRWRRGYAVDSHSFVIGQFRSLQLPTGVAEEHCP